MNPPPAGYKSSEFWLSTAACLLAGLTAAGVFSEASTAAKIIGSLSSALIALGYTGSRLNLKNAAAKDEAPK